MRCVGAWVETFTIRSYNNHPSAESNRLLWFEQRATTYIHCSECRWKIKLVVGSGKKKNSAIIVQRFKTIDQSTTRQPVGGTCRPDWQNCCSIEYSDSRNCPMRCGIEPLHPTRVDFQRGREKSGDGQTSFLSQRLWTIHTKAKRQQIKKIIS